MTTLSTKLWSSLSTIQHQLLQDVPSNTSSEESDGGEPAELKPLVLEFDWYWEPVLKYADDVHHIIMLFYLMLLIFTTLSFWCVFSCIYLLLLSYYPSKRKLGKRNLIKTMSTKTLLVALNSESCVSSLVSFPGSFQAFQLLRGRAWEWGYIMLINVYRVLS